MAKAQSKAAEMAKAQKKYAKAQFKSLYAKDRSVMMFTLVFFLLVACAGLVGTLYFFWMTKPQPSYFGATADGKVFIMEPLNRPYLNERQLFQWVVEAAVASYTFDFVNYQSDIQEAEVYYTQSGYRQLIKALRDSRTLDDVRNKKLVATAVPSGAPILIEEGVRNNRYFWRIQVPLKVSYQSASEVIPQNLVVTMVVSRAPVEEKAKGIGIDSIVVREGRIRP